MRSMMRVMLGAGSGGGGGGGGGCGVVLATAYDDNFDCGSDIDTTGARFSGANAWTAFSDVSVTRSQSGGQLLMLVASNGNLWAPKVVEQTVPSGDWTFETECGLTTNGSFSAVGLYLEETATGKQFCPDFHDDGGSWVGASTATSLGGPGWGRTAVSGLAGKLEVSRVSGSFTVRYDTGSGWATALSGIAQTTPFTTAPDKIGVFHAPRRNAGSDQAYFNYFKRTA